MVISPTVRTLTQLIGAAFPIGEVAIPMPQVRAEAWFDIAQTAQQHNLACLLYAALREMNLAVTPPEAVTLPLHEAYYRTKIANWIALSEVSELLALFAREQIQSILLKGVALAKLVYPVAALRPMSDVDILIQRADISRVSEILQSRGFEKCSEPTEGFYEQFWYHRQFTRRIKPPLIIEVHWHLFTPPYYRERIPIDWFWRRTMPMQIDGQSARALNPAAQLIHLAAHAVLQHQGHYLLAVYDLALVLARYRHQIDWDDVIKSAREFGVSRILLSHLALAQDAWGVFIPENVLAQLKRSVGVRENFIYTIFTTRRIQARMLWDGLNLPGFRSKLQYLKSVFFPNRAHLQKRYGLAGSRAIVLYRFQRLGRGARLFGQSLASMAGNVASELWRNWK